ncbi:MAG: ribosomal protein S18-alanine N-acetyltransferase [Spirulinaceae cyanobacterium SM2_1_0]|nr:ribosomal protein S18-alanine N-acetyltransferase [Spirulinaceae cyanobacterium SM2_1_0]
MTFSELHLQPLTAAQLAAATELDRVCLGGLWSLDGYQRELDSPNSELLGLRLATLASPPLIGLGCFWAILEEAHLTLLAIHPDYQRHGLGQLLLLTLLQRAAQRGLERATLEVREHNVAALALYTKFGFQVAGRRPGYYATTQEDALILWRSGLQPPQFAEELAAWQAIVDQRLRDRGWSWPAEAVASAPA